jgi:pyrimidine operon attenuation protein/uracil phosphoribosyltransferase
MPTAIPSDFSKADIQHWIQDLSSQLLQEELGEFVFVGIVRGGDILARRLSESIAKQSGYCPPVFHIDITMYRDDLYTGLEHPSFGGSNLPLDLDGQRIVLVDDVLFTGRTIRAALQEIMDYGRPSWIKLLVLVDRGCRELPIQPDFVGHNILLPQKAKLKVSISETGEQDGVTIQDGVYQR